MTLYHRQLPPYNHRHSATILMLDQHMDKPTLFRIFRQDMMLHKR